MANTKKKINSTIIEICILTTSLRTRIAKVIATISKMITLIQIFTVEVIFLSIVFEVIELKKKGTKKTK